MEKTDQNWRSPISGVSGVPFTPELNYTTFSGEHYVDQDTGNIVFHFFLPPDASAQLIRIFREENGFGAALTKAAIEHFKSGPPRLTASFLEDQRAWGFRAGGFALEGSLTHWTDGFYARLDAELDALLGQVQNRP